MPISRSLSRAKRLKAQDRNEEKKRNSISSEDAISNSNRIDQISLSSDSIHHRHQLRSIFDDKRYRDWTKIHVGRFFSSNTRTHTHTHQKKKKIIRFIWTMFGEVGTVIEPRINQTKQGKKKGRVGERGKKIENI